MEEGGAGSKTQRGAGGGEVAGRRDARVECVEWGRGRHCEMGRREGFREERGVGLEVGQGVRGRDLGEVGSGRLRGWEEEWGAYGQNDLEIGYKSPGEASRAEAPKK